MKPKHFLICLALLPGMTARAQTWYCGYPANETVAATLSGDTLVISGTGKMQDYHYAREVPWDSSRSSIATIVIEDGVTNIGSEVFRECRVTSVTIPNSVTSIGEWAFPFCNELTSVTIPNSVTGIGNYAFYECAGLTSVTIGNSVTSIGSDVFLGCSGLNAIDVESGNRHYLSENGVLYNKTKDTLIKYPARKTGAFAIPNSVTRIEKWAFQNCSGLTSVIIPDGVASIGGSAFSGCRGLTSVTIPNSVARIEEWAFYGCRGLTSVTIGDGVTSIWGCVFAHCNALRSVTNMSAIPQPISSHVFDNLNLDTIALYVPASSLNLYRTAQVWSSFGTIIPIIVAPAEVELNITSVSHAIGDN